MKRDNTDRYGYRHRKDPEYGLGESSPGDVGDSQGTFYDRASSDNNVIVGGKVEEYENHKRSQISKVGSKSNHNSVLNNNNTKPKRNSLKLDGKVVSITVERISGSGNPIATYRGKDIHVPEGEPGESYKAKLTAKDGYFIGAVKRKE